MDVRRAVAPRLVGSVLALIVVGGAGAAIASDSPADTDVSEATRASVAKQLAALPGIPLVLPARVPAGYSWQGLDSFETDSGHVVGRSSTFAAWGDLDDSPTVQVCAHTAAAHACPRGDWSIEREIAGLGVTIAFLGGQGRTSADTAFWETVRLSDSLDVPWLSD